MIDEKKKRGEKMKDRKEKKKNEKGLELTLCFPSRESSRLNERVEEKEEKRRKSGCNYFPKRFQKWRDRGAPDSL